MKLKAGREYDALAEAVEIGASFGWHRAFKHTETPTAAVAIAEITREVLDAICDRFDFDEETLR